VGIAMGIAGTKVARAAADIVILDDDFKSIVKAILWGRAIYDNIRKFLQFQLTVNVVALLLVLIGTIAGFETPLTSVQMLWVNLVMDTFGALALGTEPPTMDMLDRKPYKRSSGLLSRPMKRNILVISLYQLIVLLLLLFEGPQWFNIIGGVACGQYKVNKDSVTQQWNATTGSEVSGSSNDFVTCADFDDLCSVKDQYCYERDTHSKGSESFRFDELDGYEGACLECTLDDYTHGTIIFNTFIFFQIFNEYTSRSILSEWNVFRNLFENYSFLAVTTVTIGCQILLVEKGVDFVRTTPLNLTEWLVTIMIGSTVLLVGILMRFIPVDEDPDSFFDYRNHYGEEAKHKTSLSIETG